MDTRHVVVHVSIESRHEVLPTTAVTCGHSCDVSELPET